MMLPVAAQFARTATREWAGSALPEAPITGVGEERRAATHGRRRLAAVLRRTADRLEPVAH
jgi:hypothetical protein